MVHIKYLNIKITIISTDQTNLKRKKFIQQITTENICELCLT